MIEICCWHYCNNKFSPGAGAVVAPRVARTRLAQWEMTAKAVMLRCCGECPVQSRTVHTWWHVGLGHHGLVHTCEAMGWSTHGHVWPGQQDTHWASPCAPTWLLTWLVSLTERVTMTNVTHLRALRAQSTHATHAITDPHKWTRPVQAGFHDPHCFSFWVNGSCI